MIRVVTNPWVLDPLAIRGMKAGWRRCSRSCMARRGNRRQYLYAARVVLPEWRRLRAGRRALCRVLEARVSGQAGARERRLLFVRWLIAHGRMGG